MTETICVSTTHYDGVLEDLMMYMRADFDKTTDHTQRLIIIRKAEERKLPSNFIHDLEKDL